METDLAYLAGFFDGEGSIVLAKVQPRKPRRELNPYYQPYISIANCNPQPIRMFKEYFNGGNVFLHPRRPRERKCWSWRTGHYQAFEALKRLYPYLIIKKEQARLIFILHSLRMMRRTRKHENEMLEVFEKIRSKIKELNHREFEKGSD